MLLQRHHVSERLARVLFVTERVDHVQRWRCGCHRCHLFLRVRSDDEGVYPALEIPRHVVQRFACSVRERRGYVQRVGAQFLYRDFEGGTGPQRRLLEEHRDVASRKRGGRRRVTAETAVGLQLPGQVEQAAQIGRGQIED